jgi:hypothetical protein
LREAASEVPSQATGGDTKDELRKNVHDARWKGLGLSTLELGSALFRVSSDALASVVAIK